jgi:hypothetical protein
VGVVSFARSRVREADPGTELTALEPAEFAAMRQAVVRRALSQGSGAFGELAAEVIHAERRRLDAELQRSEAELQRFEAERRLSAVCPGQRRVAEAVWEAEKQRLEAERQRVLGESQQFERDRGQFEADRAQWEADQARIRRGEIPGSVF